MKTNDSNQRVVLEGDNSDIKKVESGVELGPSLLQFYINDMPYDISPALILFADDTIAYYLTVSAESKKIKDDINKLATCEDKG